MKKIQRLRLPSYRPPATILVLLFMAVTIFVLVGGLYDLMERPVIVFPSPSQPIWYYSGMNDQTLNESLFFGLAMVMGVSGTYLAYRSTRHAYRPREARMFLIVGVVLMSVAFICCEVLMAWKGL